MKNVADIAPYHILWLFLCLSQGVLGGVMQRRREVASNSEAARAQLEQEARVETEHLLNALFRSQIDYFSKVKVSLAAKTQRAHDIEAYIARLNQAIAVKDIAAKDRMWLDIFKDFSKSPLLLNEQNETGLTTTEYERILVDNGIQEVVKNFLADVATYFLKMAKVSGKVMEVAIVELANNNKKLYNPTPIKLI